MFCHRLKQMGSYGKPWNLKKKTYLFCTVVSKVESFVGNSVLLTLYINKKYIHRIFIYIP